jgi:Mitochondrial domain of unknown function (DUF1713)
VRTDLVSLSGALPANLDGDLTNVARRSRSGPATVKPAPVPLMSGDRKIVPRGFRMGSVVKKRRKRMAKKKHRKLLRKTRVQRRRLGK